MNAVGRLFISLHAWVYRTTGGRVGGSFGDHGRVLLLTTTGRKSGQPRTVPLMAYEEGGDWHVVASNNGAAEHPHWYGNLVANPRVRIQLEEEAWDATATALEGAERDGVFSRLKAVMPQFQGYEGKVAGAREIPVIRLRKG